MVHHMSLLYMLFMGLKDGRSRPRRELYAG